MRERSKHRESIAAPSRLSLDSIEKISWALLFVAATALVATRGFGDLLLFRIGAAGSLGIIAYQAFSRRLHLGGLISIIFLLSASKIPGILYLYGVFVAPPIVIAWQIQQQKTQERYLTRALLFSAGGLLAVWIVQLTPAGSWLVQPFATATLFATSGLVAACCSLRAITMLCAAPLALTAFVLFPAEQMEVEIGSNMNLSPGYRHGEVLRSVIGGQIVAPEMVRGDIGITSLFYPGTNKSAHPIYLSEHDVAPDSRHPVLRSENLHQPPPWHTKQFLGSQYLLFAIANDGGWASNLGGSLDRQGTLLLGSLHHSSAQFEPIVIRLGKSLYLQDSDPFVDRLVPYSRQAVTEITRPQRAPRWINFLCVAAALIQLIKPSLIPLLLPALTSAAISLGGTQGFVRIVAKPGSPHDLSGPFGVPRVLADTGYRALIGDRNTEVLVIGPNRTARTREGERLILLGSNSTVKIGGAIVQAGNIPLGSIEEVADARMLSLEGQEAGIIVRMGDVIVIGTSSPAKVEWTKYLK